MCDKCAIARCMANMCNTLRACARMEIYIYVIETYRECTFRIVRGKSKISSLICNITFYLPLAAVMSIVVIRIASSFQIHLPTIATLAGLRIHAQQRVDIYFHLCDSGKFISRFLCLVLLLFIPLSIFLFVCPFRLQ